MAHWTRRTHLFQSDEYICSVCNAAWDRPYTACPSCGASMDQTKYDPSWVDEAAGAFLMMDDDW